MYLQHLILFLENKVDNRDSYMLYDHKENNTFSIFSRKTCFLQEKFCNSKIVSLFKKIIMN